MADVIIRKISAGASTFLFDVEGNIYACGRNDYAQLGLGFTGEALVPERISLNNMREIYCGELHTIFLSVDNSCWACGNNEYGQLGIGRKATMIKQPERCLVGNVDKVTFFGCYTLFRQNIGVLSLAGASPNEGIVRDGPMPVANINEIITKDCDSFIKLNPIGRPYIMGFNRYGELGNINNEIINNEETTLPLYKGLENIVKIVQGGEHVAFLTKEGSVFTVGSNDKYQLGYLTPQSWIGTPGIISLNNVADVACGYDHTIVLLENGEAWGFGSNQFGQLGLGRTEEYATRPVKLFEDVMKIYCGEFNTFIVKKSGTILVSGYNKYGNLGDGSKANIYYFTPMQGFTFDTTLYTFETPDDKQIEYEKGAIKHTIEIIYTSKDGNTLISTCFINTPSTGIRRQYGSPITNKITTANVDTIQNIADTNANILIPLAKEYINDNTMFHRDAIYKTKTIIRFNNGTYIERDGKLTEEECRQIADEYIKDKYNITSDKVTYYNDTDYRNSEILGEPTWTPSKGAEVHLLSELDKRAYNTY